MKIKVCGMKHPQNISDLSNLSVDYIGFIFYPKSPRYCDNMDDIGLLENINKVGVFVNENIETVIQKIKEYNLSCVQLHGKESVEYCILLKEKMPDIHIFKAFSIADSSDFIETERYTNAVDYFLFDTKTELFGGSGKKFDWRILNSYKGKIPFLLSGGIGQSDVADIKQIQHPSFYGIDLNSRFEIEPGLKDIELLNQFIKDIRE